MITSKIAQLANVTSDTVRYYTKRGLLVPSRNPSNGYKEYQQADLERLKFIHQARTIGFTLNEIEQILEHALKGDSPCPSVRMLMAKKIEDTRTQIESLTAHLATLEKTFAGWENQPNSIPDGQSICCLIESWADEGNIDE
jgi:DNA-binding transcriptional MerR regulator